MKSCLVVLCTIVLVQICYAPPVTQNKKENADSDEDSGVKGLEDYMEYHRYLKEVVNALESDPQFREKLEKADEHEIKSGKIADELEFVSHHVRTRLDEIKRIELERLKQLMEEKRKLEGESNAIEDDPVHHHLDHSNKHTFEIEDLKKLIAKTTQDLAEADKKRREQFKEYELEKEYKKQVKLNHTNGEDRDKLEKEMKVSQQELEAKHKKHEKLHEPGHQAQLEEVWQEQDQMQQDFDPKTFFMLHDLDGNGLWDQDEVKSLFIKELDKMYQQGAPEDDMRERIEEMERMRETVFQEMDQNKDGFIDFNEFLHQTNTNEFKEDHGWQALDERRPFTDEELAEYIRQHEEANQIHQAHPGAYQVPGGYQQVPQGYQQLPSGAYQIPQEYQQQQVPPGGYHQSPPAQYHPSAVPQAQYQQGQVPQHPAQQGHVPQLQLNTNEVYPHQQQGYQHPGQVNYQNQQGNYAPPPNHQAVPQPQQVYQQPQQVNRQNQHPQQVNQQQQGNPQPPQVNQQQQVNQQPPQVNQQQVNQQQQVNNQPPQVNQQQQVNNQPPQVNQQQQVNQQPPQVNQLPQINQQPPQVQQQLPNQPNVQSNQIPRT